MALSDLIPNGGVAVDLGASSRKQALQAMSDMSNSKSTIVLPIPWELFPQGKPGDTPSNPQSEQD